MDPKVPWGPDGRLPLAYMQRLSASLVEILKPYCDRIEVAGSIRRQKPTIKDVELLCVPKMQNQGVPDLFGDHGPECNLLEERLEYIRRFDGLLVPRKNRAGHRIGWGPKNKFAVHQPTGVPIDMFTADEKNWGMFLVIRTGSAGFNIRMMSRFQDLGMKGTVLNGVIGRDGESIDCPDEETVFRLLEWDYLKPSERNVE